MDIWNIFGFIKSLWDNIFNKTNRKNVSFKAKVKGNNSKVTQYYKENDKE